MPVLNAYPIRLEFKGKNLIHSFNLNLITVSNTIYH